MARRMTAVDKSDRADRDGRHTAQRSVQRHLTAGERLNQER
jgi:hypothetical protein